MNYKITDKNGIKLKTANKYCTEDINVTIDENLINGGGEAARITIGSNYAGTAVPRTGTIENIYFNKELTTEEVVALLSQLDYADTYDGNGNVLPIKQYTIIVLNNSGELNTYLIYKYNDDYLIAIDRKGNDDDIFVFSTNSTFYGQNIGFKGWNPNLEYPYVENKEIFLSQGQALQNDLISSLVSVTEFVATGPKEEIKLEGDYKATNIDVTENKTLDIKTLIENDKEIPLTVTVKVKSQGGNSGGTVPNSGHVDKVYFNTSLSVDEVVEMLEPIEFVIDGGAGYVIASDETSQSAIFIFNVPGVWVGIIATTPTIGMLPIFSSANNQISASMGCTFEGWLEGFDGIVELNVDVVPTGQGFDFGHQNDLLTSLCSITPFNGGSGGGAKVVVPPTLPVEVPGDGSLVDIYVNTSLSIAEVDSILDTIEIVGSSSSYIVYPFWDGSYVGYLQIEKGYTGWYIKNFITYETIYDSTGGSGGFEGWNPNFNGVIKYTQFVKENGYGYADPLYDNQNAKLINLFSITPFGEDGEEVVLSGEYDGTTLEPEIYEGTPVPSSGYIDTIYFNTSLSNDEVISILDEFFNNHPELKDHCYYEVACIDENNGTYVCIEIPSDGGYAMYGYPVIYQSIYGLYAPNFEGWNPECNGIVLCKANLVTNEYTGMYNSELSRLFSITPFKSDIDAIDLKQYINEGKIPLKIKLK